MNYFIDLKLNKKLQQGNKELGEYSILIKEDGRMSACYDLIHEHTKDKRPQNRYTLCEGITS
ncbi:MAG: hypothetical protein Q9M40_12650 [Sulfurimonas sp.]|nr:hypothetical protein [Sulfurimonas sp.]